MNTYDLNNLQKLYIGLNRFTRDLSSVERPDVNYPPYNIVQKDPEHYVIEVAVAGFTPEEINITTQDGNLQITSNRVKVERDYAYHGIAEREFELAFRLHEFVKVQDATFRNGILSVNLEYQIPEQLKPQTIEIKSI
jgi:molecular chaperone IbpA